MIEQPVFFRFQCVSRKLLIIQGKRAEKTVKMRQVFCVQNRRGFSVGDNDRKGMVFCIGRKKGRLPLPPEAPRPRSDAGIPLPYSAAKKIDSQIPCKGPS